MCLCVHDDGSVSDYFVNFGFRIVSSIVVDLLFSFMILSTDSTYVLTNYKMTVTLGVETPIKKKRIVFQRL